MLDKTRPYAQVIGDNEGRAFEQDGRFFTGAGAPWTPPAAPAADAESVAPAEAAPRARRIRATPTEAPAPAPASEADAQIAAQLEG